MKTAKLMASVAAIAMILLAFCPNLSWAGDDGAGTYKAKCAACHGADAAGKPAAKIPSLVSDEEKKVSDADLGKKITDTAKHPAGVKSLTPDDVKAVVSYIRGLQK
jgi:mono/diheme cytochrome c family protein